MSESLRTTFWNVAELGATTQNARVRRDKVLAHLFKEPWDIIGLTAVGRQSIEPDRPAWGPPLGDMAAKRGYRIVHKPLDKRISGGSGRRDQSEKPYTVLMIREDIDVDVTGFAETPIVDKVCGKDGGTRVREKVVFASAAAVLRTGTGRSLAVVCVYTPVHKGRVLDLSSALRSACDFQRENRADGLLVAGDFNVLTDREPAYRDRLHSLDELGADQHGQWPRELLQDADSRKRTYEYPADDLREGFPDKAVVRLSDEVWPGTEASLEVTEPPKDDTDLGVLSDHAQLVVTITGMSARRRG
ncbi:hypothetical protein [Nesterenkonia suensis]